MERVTVPPLEPLHSEPEAHVAQTPDIAAGEVLAGSQDQEEDVVEDESEAEIHSGSFPTAAKMLNAGHSQ